MPRMFDNAWEGQNRALGLMIPLLMQKKQDEKELSYKQQRLALEQQKLDDEATKRAEELKRKIDETKAKRAMELGKLYGNNAEAMQTIGPQIESLTGLNLPKEQTPPPSIYGTLGSTPALNDLVDQGRDVRYLPTPQKEGTPSSLSKLIEERDALPEGDPTRSLFDQAINKAITSKGMVVESDGKGGFTIRTNVDQGASSMQKPTITKIEERLLGANEGLSRISNIVRSFKPEFQEIPTRLGTTWSSLKSKMGIVIPEEEKTRLEEYGAYKQDALENINLYIKEITGAQMSEKEANRLRKAQPDPGDGIFGGDDPVTFKSKLENTYKKLRMSQIRYNFYLKQGLGENVLKELIKNDDIISIERMEKILDEKGDEYANELKRQNPGIDTTTLFEQVRIRLSREFNVEF